MRLFLTIMGILALTGTALSQTLPEISEPLTRIEADNEAHVIRFIVNGKEVGRLAERGLEVENSIVYGGTITDRGRTSKATGDVEVPNAP